MAIKMPPQPPPKETVQLEKVQLTPQQQQQVELALAVSRLAAAGTALDPAALAAATKQVQSITVAMPPPAPTKPPPVPTPTPKPEPPPTKTEVKITPPKVIGDAGPPKVVVAPKISPLPQLPQLVPPPEVKTDWQAAQKFLGKYITEDTATNKIEIDIYTAVKELTPDAVLTALRSLEVADAAHKVEQVQTSLKAQKTLKNYIKDDKVDIFGAVQSLGQNKALEALTALGVSGAATKVEDAQAQIQRMEVLSRYKQDGGYNVIALSQDLREEGKTERQITTYLSGLGFNKETAESTAWWTYATPEQRFDRMVEQDPKLKGAVYAGESKEDPGMPTYYPPDSDIAKLVARFEDPKENPLWKLVSLKGIVPSKEFKQIRDVRQTYDFEAKLDELTPSQQGEVLSNYARWLKAKGMQEWEFGAAVLGTAAQLGKEKLLELTAKYPVPPGSRETIEAAGGFAMTTAVGFAMLPMLPGLLVTKPQATVTGMKRFVSGAATGAARGEPWAAGELAAIVVPFVPWGKAIVKGVYARVRPDTMPGSATSLVADVGRAEVPKGMSPLAARELLGEVEILGEHGTIPASRLRALEGVPKVDSVSITRTPSGVSDIKLRSADGDVVGHVSGTMRVMSDVIYHGTADTMAIVRAARQRGFDSVYRAATEAEKAILSRMKSDFLERGFEPFAKAIADEKALLTRIHENMDFVVKDMGAAAHHGQFWSPQPAHTFALRYIADLAAKGKQATPGFIAAKIAHGEIRTPPKAVLDSPTLAAMRGKMEALSRTGKLKEGIYTLYKGYRDQAGRMILEYELYATPGTKFKVADPTWYAPGDVPRTYIGSKLTYEGKGPKVGAGDRLPTYWFASEKASALGQGVPTLAQMYLAKVFGDITLIRQYAPWNLRPAKWALKGEADVYSPSPFISSYTPIAFHAVKAGKGGRATVLISNPEGRILLTRTLGQNRYDLPGGSPIKRGLRGESLRKAAERELWEEVGLKADYLDHVDTLTGKFTGKGKDQTFQIFEGFTKEKPKPGSEIADYVWWDGRSRLRYPVADFVHQTLTRAKVRNQAADIAMATHIVRDTLAKATDRTLKQKLLKLDKEMGKEVAKSLEEASDRGTIPYKPSRATLATLAEGALGIVSGARGRPRVEDIVPERVRPYPRMEGRPTIERLLEEARAIEKMPLEEIPKEGLPIEKVPKEKVPIEKLPREAIPEEKVPIEKVPVERVPIEKVPTEKVPKEHVPIAKAPIGPPKIEIRRVEGVPKRDPGIVEWDQGVVRISITPPYREGTRDVHYTAIKPPAKGEGSPQRTIRVKKGNPPTKIELQQGFSPITILKGKRITFGSPQLIKHRGPGLLTESGRLIRQRRRSVLT